MPHRHAQLPHDDGRTEAEQPASWALRGANLPRATARPPKRRGAAKRGTVVALDEHDVRSYLDRLRTRFGIDETALRCGACGTRLTSETLGVVRRRDGAVLFGCDDCVLPLGLSTARSAVSFYRSLLRPSWAVIAPQTADLSGIRTALDRALVHDALRAWSPLLAGISVLPPSPVTGGLGALTATGLVYLWLWHPEKVARAAHELRSGARATHSWVGRRQMARDVEQTISSGATAYASEVEDGVISPALRKVRVRWTDGQNEYVDPTDDEAIIVMRRHERRGKNIAKALRLLLEGVLMPQARRSIEETTRAAIEFHIADEILRGERAQGARHALSENFKLLELTSPALALAIRRMERVLRRGWLTRLLLPEYVRTASSYSSAGAPPEYVTETAHFAAWLYLHASWLPGDAWLPSFYDGDFLRVAMVRAGWKADHPHYGARAYAKAVRFDRKRGADVVYLLAYDDDVDGAQRVYEALTGETQAPPAYRLPWDWERPAHLRHDYAFVGRVWRRTRRMPDLIRVDNAFLRRRGDCCTASLVTSRWPDPPSRTPVVSLPADRLSRTS